jgi:hypothetical protein
VQIFEWQQPFTGAQPEVPAEEQRMAAEEFTEYVGMLMLSLSDERGCRLPEAVEHRLYSPEGAAESEFVYLRTRYDVDPAHPNMLAYRQRPLRSRGGRLDDAGLRIHGRIAQSSKYILEAGALVRWDAGEEPRDQILPRQPDGSFSIVPLPPGISGKEKLDAILAGVDEVVENEIANTQLELDMRVNGQPVGLEEARLLIATHIAAVPLLR